MPRRTQAHICDSPAKTVYPNLVTRKHRQSPTEDVNFKTKVMTIRAIAGKKMPKKYRS